MPSSTARPRSVARSRGVARRLFLVLAAGLALAGCASASAPAPRAPNGFTTDTLSPISKESVTTGAAGAGGATQGGAPTAFKDTAKIVWTGSMQLQVKDLDVALADAQTAITGMGGYISASRRTGSEQPVGAVTYRIPSDRWQDGLAALRKLSIKVVDEQTNSADVASELVDMEARLKNLRASETALQAIAASATKVSDVLEVQARLSEVRGQIESLAAQQAALQDKVGYGTLTATFGLQVVAITQAAKQWDPATEVDAAGARLVGILQSLASAAIWFVIVWLPTLLVLGVVIVLVVRVGRRMGVRLPSMPAGPAAPATGWVAAAPGGGVKTGDASASGPVGHGTMGE